MHMPCPVMYVPCILCALCAVARELEGTYTWYLLCTRNSRVTWRPPTARLVKWFGSLRQYNCVGVDRGRHGQWEEHARQVVRSVTKGARCYSLRAVCPAVRLNDFRHSEPELSPSGPGADDGTEHRVIAEHSGGGRVAWLAGAQQGTRSHGRRNRRRARAAWGALWGRPARGA